MRHGVLGRRAELEAVEEMLIDDSALARLLLFEGEAGIGKTTVWRAAVDVARARGFHILECQPAESETTLPFAALADLLALVPDTVLAELPGAQKQALDAALQRGDDVEPANRLAVGRAVVTLTRGLAEDVPLAIAVDDFQWLDPPTERTLEFVVRRLVDLPVLLLVARRSTGDAPPPLGVTRALPGERIRTLRIGPLPEAMLDDLLRERLSLRLPRPRLVELRWMTGGNPFYALEIGRLLQARGTDGGGALPLPSSLGAALKERIESLPESTRDALLLTAAALQPTADLLERAAGQTDGLADALSQNLLVLADRKIRFTHPLLGTAAYDAARPWDRREAHRRLAAAADDPVERASHLASASEERDEETAELLTSAAAVASARGGPETAASLAEAAAQRTPSDDDSRRRERLIAAADYHVAAGNPERGRAILEELIASTPAGPARASLLYRLADAIGESLPRSIALCEQALAEAGGEADLEAEIHNALSIFTWLAGDLERSTEHCRACVRLAERVGDEVQLAIAVGELCHAEAVLGRAWDHDSIAWALDFERRHGDFPTQQPPSVSLAVASTYTDDLETARPLLCAQLERVTSRGDEPGRAAVLFRCSELELRAGNWAEALAAAREANTITRQSGIEQEQLVTMMWLATVLAHIGELGEARDLGERAYAGSTDAGDRVASVRCAGALGLVELSAGDSHAALEWLTPARRELERMRIGELSIYTVVQNEIEALVSIGRLEEAEHAIRLVEEHGRPTGRSWHRAIAGRNRALVASARGEIPAARAALEDALAAHESLPQPFELARTLLVQGLIERRAKRWRAARDALGAALERFDHLGARAWAERAATELARVGGRPPVTSKELTETEQRIAQLAAQGASNKEIAAALFVTVRTVETNLTRVYAKLGIRSRTELAARSQ